MEATLSKLSSWIITSSRIYQGIEENTVHYDENYDEEIPDDIMLDWYPK